jgi:intracellular multiplication protein IcmP
MAGAAPQSGGQKEPDSAYTPLWIIAAVFIAGILIWHFGSKYIVAFVFNLKLIQAYAIGLFSDGLLPVVNTIEHTAPSTVEIAGLLSVLTKVGEYIRYPYIVILFIFAAILYKSDITQRFRSTYSMKTLLEKEYINWPHMTPVLKLDLVSQDIDVGPWASAISPRVFSMKNGLLKRDTTEREVMRRDRGYAYATLYRGEAKRLFVMQLGPYWMGPDALPPHTKALFAIFAAKINRDRDSVKKMLIQLSKSVAMGKLDTSGVNALLAKHRDNKIVTEICTRHAYVLTVMASMLATARHDGVLSTAEFLWLKPLDRRLWYMLNSVGRETSFTEVAGPFAHWLVEKVLNRRVLVPMVTEAVNALEGEIKNMKFKEDDLPL